MQIFTFSIVTPSYNQEQFIEDTIKSILSQEGDFYIDYVVMDGGSTDNSIEIIKKYDRLLKEGKWPVRCRGIQYRWVSEEDKGQTDAINKGLKKSHGEIVAYLNSDDIYLSGTMQRAVEYFTENKHTDIIYGDCKVIDGGGNTISIWRSREFDLFSELCRNFIYQPTVFMRRKVLDRIGYFNEGLHYTMDIDYWYRAAVHANLAYVPAELAIFRIAGDNKSSQSRVHFVQERGRVLERFFSIYAEDTIKGWKKRVFAWHYYHAGEQLYAKKEFDEARKGFVKSMRLEPFSLKAFLSFLAIVDMYMHTRLFPKTASILGAILQPSLERRFI